MTTIGNVIFQNKKRLRNPISRKSSISNMNITKSKNFNNIPKNQLENETVIPQKNLKNNNIDTAIAKIEKIISENFGINSYRVNEFQNIAPIAIPNIQYYEELFRNSYSQNNVIKKFDKNFNNNIVKIIERINENNFSNFKEFLQNVMSIFYVDKSIINYNKYNKILSDNIYNDIIYNIFNSTSKNDNIKNSQNLKKNSKYYKEVLVPNIFNTYMFVHILELLEKYKKQQVQKQQNLEQKKQQQQQKQKQQFFQGLRIPQFLPRTNKPNNRRRNLRFPTSPIKSPIESQKKQNELHSTRSTSSTNSNTNSNTNTNTNSNKFTDNNINILEKYIQNEKVIDTPMARIRLRQLILNTFSKNKKYGIKLKNIFDKLNKDLIENLSTLEFIKDLNEHNSAQL